VFASDEFYLVAGATHRRPRSSKAWTSGERIGRRALVQSFVEQTPGSWQRFFQSVMAPALGYGARAADGNVQTG